MRAIAAGLTDIGRERNHNEDRFILLPEFNVFVVADGMGGHQSGEVASRMAASSIASFFRTANGAAPDDVQERLKAAVSDANAKIFARADDSRAHRGMGTTVVAAAFHPDAAQMHVVHAGDSRAYHLRNGEFRQLTRDHSLLSDALLERPELTESDLAYLPRNVITRALGIAPTVDIDQTACEAEPGDVFLLCSDGLHGLVDDDHIKQIIRDTDVLTEACMRLIDAANKNGGKDNITAVLVRIEEEEEPWSVRSPGAIPGGPARVSSPPPHDGAPRSDRGRAAASGTEPVSSKEVDTLSPPPPEPDGEPIEPAPGALRAPAVVVAGSLDPAASPTDDTPPAPEAAGEPAADETPSPAVAEPSAAVKPPTKKKTKKPR